MFTAPPAACSHRPRRPSNGSKGPVIPAAAKCAANTAARVELAAAQPFHIDSSPVRVTPSGSCGVTAREMAWPICCWSSPSSRPAPQTAPMTPNIP